MNLLNACKMAFASRTLGSRVATSSLTSLFYSSDGLQTYSQVATTEGVSDDPAVRFAFEDVVFAPADASIVYAATTGLLVYKSVDGGASFTLMKNIRSEALNAAP